MDFKTTSWIRFNLKFISKQKISNFSYTCAFTLQMIHIIYEYILCMGFINVLNLRVSQYKLCMIHLIYAMYGVELRSLNNFHFWADMLNHLSPSHPHFVNVKICKSMLIFFVFYMYQCMNHGIFLVDSTQHYKSANHDGSK